MFVPQTVNGVVITISGCSVPRLFLKYHTFPPFPVHISYLRLRLCFYTDVFFYMCVEVTSLSSSTACPQILSMVDLSVSLCAQVLSIVGLHVIYCPQVLSMAGL